MPAISDRSHFGPISGDVDAGEGPDEMAAHVYSAVGYGVDFCSAWFADVPAFGSNFDLCFDDAFASW
ncbi:hypothetical protein AAFN60_18855 [Roseibacillus persicicus]|uniref:hypothetical protein n=1 Tax=Roseibacillus persicicus TaxID=454148 RepID=UPI00398BA66F